MAEPAYNRLQSDERRALLLELGAELFTQHGYDELSMARIAREAGISKGLLYHYFPGKQEFFRATLAQKAEELQARTEPDPSLPPLDQLVATLDAYLGWIEENAAAYTRVLESAGSVPELRELVRQVRERAVNRILEGLVGGDGPPPPAARVAAHGWLWFMDGACLDWLAHRDVSRDELRGLLLAALAGGLAGAGIAPAGAADAATAAPEGKSREEATTDARAESPSGGG